ncbi:MAG TPA: menaquinone biosynthesis decarboxylase [candidate division Zixibacteria bacterium]|nr:menaquinone biosynthesis decarboxylase [candidate division Zixibacteria bacterium]
MAYKDLSEFINALEEAGQLKRISVQVSRDLEITEITDRLSKGDGAENKALLFENVEGFATPVLINTFGTEHRMSMAAGVENLEELNEKLSKLIDMRLPEGMSSTLSRAAELFGALRAAGLKPDKVRKAPCQEVVYEEDATLDMLPILKCWPEDGGRYITLMQVITRDPATNQRNVGMYRVQIFDGKTAAMHWQRHKGGAEHERLAQELNQTKIPAAIVLGGDPAQMWCASAPLPPGIDEYLLAGWLRGKPVTFVDCITQPLEVPANAEIVIEGYVDTEDQRLEGPFGDHTGYYTPADYFPTFHVTAITSKTNPVYPTTVVGKPPMEDYWMGKATERLFLPLMKIFMGEIVDINMPAEGVFHNLIIVSMKKRFPGHPFKVCYGLWGLGLMMLAKAIVIVDHDVDVHNLSEVGWHVLGNVDWRRDTIIVDGPVDQLDHSSVRESFGGKIGIDATAKGTFDAQVREWPSELIMSEEIKALVNQKWDSYGFDRQQESEAE